MTANAITCVDPADLDPTGPTAAQYAAGKVLLLSALSMVRVNIKAAGIVSVRPWYWRYGDWWPLHGDGAAAGAAPVNAVPAVYGGRAEGYFAGLGLSCPVMMVTETGIAYDVTTCYIERAEANL